MIHFWNLKGKFIENATITDIQKGLNKLFLSRNGRSCISLMNESELALDIYRQTIILQDYGMFKYDGPDGPGELLSVRYKEGSIFNRIEEAINFLENEEIGKLKKLLKSLPKPK